MSLLEDMLPDDVLGLLDEANEWLQSAFGAVSPALTVQAPPTSTTSSASR